MFIHDLPPRAFVAYINDLKFQCSFNPAPARSTYLVGWVERDGNRKIQGQICSRSPKLLEQFHKGEPWPDLEWRASGDHVLESE